MPRKFPPAAAITTNYTSAVASSGPVDKKRRSLSSWDIFGDWPLQTEQRRRPELKIVSAAAKAITAVSKDALESDSNGKTVADQRLYLSPSPFSVDQLPRQSPQLSSSSSERNVPSSNSNSRLVYFFNIKITPISLKRDRGEGFSISPKMFFFYIQLFNMNFFFIKIAAESFASQPH